MTKAAEFPAIIAVGLSEEEVARASEGLGAPVEAVAQEGAGEGLASPSVELVLTRLDILRTLLPLAPLTARAGAGPQLLVLYPPEQAGQAEELARTGRVHVLATAGDYLDWLPRFARQALATGRAVREAVGQLADRAAALDRDKRRLDSAVECMSEGLLVIERGYRFATLNPAARRMLGVDSLDELARKLRDGAIDPGLHPIFWLDAHAPDAKPLRCWETLACGRVECPAHGSGLFPCWLYDGTVCHDGGPGRFPEKLAACHECVVYRGSAPLDEPSRALGRREVAVGEPAERVLESLSSPVVDEDGQILGVVKLLRDVTTERKLEEVRRQFVSFITHELRTPLTSIAGFLWLVLRGHAGPLTEAQGHQLEIAHRQVKVLEGLVGSLLDLSAIEAGRLDLDRQPFDLVPLVADTVELLRPQADARKVAVRVAPSDAPVVVDADRGRIGQVLTNLVANAIKYTAPGGPVTVRASSDGREVLVEVADQGGGIPAAELPRLFDPYYRASAVAASSRGSGLGLTICKGIVDAHGGRIWAESGEGEGSRFLFTIPPPGAVRAASHEGRPFS
jgi:signal transduction histidine kinase